MNLRPAFAALAALCLGQAGHAESIDDVLGRMDMAAKQFQSYAASVKRVDYGAILESKDESSGVMRLKRAKNGIAGIMDTTAGPDHTIIHFNGSSVERYLPKANTVERYNAKKFASIMDQMLLLGFAVTSAEIKRDYDAKLGGEEMVNGVMTSHIVLTPKSAEAQKYVKTIDLWIDAKGNALRQKGTEPDGNYRLATFSDLKVNPALPDSDFDLKPPPGTKVVNEN